MSDGIRQLIERRVSDLRQLVERRVSSLVRYSRTTLSTADGDGDQVAGHITDASEVQGGYPYTVRRLWPFGIRSRPPVDVDAVVVHAFGGSTNGVMVGAESMAYGPSDLVEGEVAIYAKKAGAVIKIDVDGKITIDAPATATVVVNGGTLKVARDTDPTLPGSLALVSTGPVAGVYTMALVYTPPGGAPATIGSWASTAVLDGSVTMAGKINGGATRFKA